MRMKTWPGWLTGTSSPASSSTRTSEPGHALPTEPGLRSHSWAVIAVPPPSLAA